MIKKELNLVNGKKEDQQIFLSLNKLNSSNLRLINYKLKYNALPKNYKFRNKYDKNVICPKIIEDCEYIFITCKCSREFYEYVKHEYLRKKKFKKLPKVVGG